MGRSCSLWLSESKVFTKTIICLFPMCHQLIYISLPIFVCGCTLVSEICELIKPEEEVEEELRRRRKRKRQLTEGKNLIFLMYTLNARPPLSLYILSTTVLGDSVHILL